MRASRLLSILILLQMRGRTSADALAAEFGVSARTIHRDIDELSAAGVPVFAERGRAGGFDLLDGYRTRLTGVTENEAGALPFAGVADAAAALGIDADLAAAQLKLFASLPPDRSASAARVAARFHVDTLGWYRRAEKTAFLPALAGAVWGDRRIRIDYESWKKGVTRELEPLGLVLKGGHWYLVAAAKDEPRVYRVANIRHLTILGEKAARPARFNLARFWSRWARDFEERLLEGRATVRITETGLRLLREASPAAAEAVDAAKAIPRPEGWIDAIIPIESVAYAARQFLRLGDEIEILSPPELRAAIAHEAAAVCALYRGKRGFRKRPRENPGP